MTWPFTVIRRVAFRFIGSKTSTSMCGMFVLSRENSCCNEQDGCERFLEGFDGKFDRLDESKAEGNLFVILINHLRCRLPSSSGRGDSHCFCNASSIFHTLTD